MCVCACVCVNITHWGLLHDLAIHSCTFCTLFHFVGPLTVRATVASSSDSYLNLQKMIYPEQTAGEYDKKSFDEWHVA